MTEKRANKYSLVTGFMWKKIIVCSHPDWFSRWIRGKGAVTIASRVFIIVLYSIRRVCEYIFHSHWNSHSNIWARSGQWAHRYKIIVWITPIRNWNWSLLICINKGAAVRFIEIFGNCHLDKHSGGFAFSRTKYWEMEKCRGHFLPK